MEQLQAAMIDILIPVLGRPHNAAPLVQNIRDTTSADVRIVFLVSRGDHAQHEACRAAMHASPPKTVVIIDTDRPAGAGDFAKKINQGCELAKGEWVFMGADDLRFEKGWDTAALKAAGDRYDVVATNDMANASVKRGIFGTHCLIRRRYVTEHGGTVDQGPGVVLFEGYDHNFVDRELCGVAQHRGVYAFARHSRVRHFHPLWKTALNDATYVKALKHFRDDQKLFLSRAHLWGHEGLSVHERKLAA